MGEWLSHLLVDSWLVIIWVWVRDEELGVRKGGGLMKWL